MTYQYEEGGRLAAVTLPDGGNIQYSYVSDNAADLAQYWLIDTVTWPDGARMSYSYNESAYGGGVGKEAYLTGKFNSDGDRIGIYAYQGNKAYSTEGYEGLKRRRVTSRTATDVTLEDGLGTKRTLFFRKQLTDGQRLLTQKNQPAGSGCAAASSAISYNDRGQVVEERNFNGVKTQYAYGSTFPFETVRVTGIPAAIYGTYTSEGVTLPKGATKTSTQWHEAIGKPYRVAEPGKLITHVYNGFPDPFNNNETAQCTTARLGEQPFPALCRAVEQPTTDITGALGFSAPLATNMEARQKQYTYDDLGRTLSISGRPDGTAETTIEYYQDTTATHNKGDIKRTSNSAGHTTEYAAYDDHGNPTQIIDSNGVATTFTYDSQGRLTSRTTAGSETTFSYDLNGNLATSLDPSGAVTHFHYNPASQLIAIENAAGESISYEYDGEGNLLSNAIKDQFGNVAYRAEHQYDALSRLQNSSTNQGAVDTLYYDAEGNQTARLDALQRRTSHSYDSKSRLAATTDPASGVTRYTYDAQDRITSVIDANGNTTSYEYDAFGNLLALDSPDTGRTTFAYDEPGNRIRKEDARGVITTYAYDALNRLVAQTYLGEPDESVTYSYDDTSDGNYGIGRLTQIAQGNLTVNYRYNHLGQVTQKTQTLGTQSSVTQYQYNDVGQLSVLTYPSGREVHYSYDSLGHVVSISTRAQAGDTLQPVVRDVAHLPFGPAKFYRYGNGLTHTQTFDLDYRLTAIQVGGINPLLSRSYFYDLTNNITGIDNALALDKSQSFDYDLLDRLIQADGTYGALSYAYDPVGNRLSETRNGATDNYNYDLDSNQLLSVQQADGTRNFTYDAAGNRIVGDSPDSQGQTYTYNAANRLTELHVDGTLAARYRYNPLGQRIEKVKGSTTERYHYDEAGHLLAVTDGNNNVLREYVYWGDQQIALAVASSGLLYLHNDHLATAQVVTNQSQQVVWMADYEPFGQVNQSTSSTQHFSRFPGQYEDEESGLYYNYFRDYDPALGRYIQSDPIGLGDGPNTYSYVHNNPLSYSDPSGQNTLLQGVGLAGRVCLSIGACRKSLQQAAQSAARGLAKCLDGDDEDVDCFDVMYDCQEKFGGTRHWGRPNTSWDEEMKRCISDTAPKCVEELGL